MAIDPNVHPVDMCVARICVTCTYNAYPEIGSRQSPVVICRYRTTVPVQWGGK